jgi:alpha-1,2-mannosyltransferase
VSAVAVRAERGSWLRLSKDPIWLAALFAVAFLMRLVPVLNGAGLLGIGQYDDGVHYGAALALVNGQFPYRDFLFLQPPGIVVALIPFAALGAATHDSLGFIVARLAWMLLGAVNAVLVARLLRRTGTLAAVAGGVFYAVYYPAIHVERSILLEGLTNACLIVALLLVLPSERRTDRPWRLAAAGALLGISTGIKIWGVVIALVVITWAVVARRPRDAGLIALGTAAGATAVCGPFFLAAPGAMWRMVVRDQVMRPANGGSLLHRLPAIAAVPGPALRPALVICLVFLCLTALSVRISSLRVAPALVIVLSAMLMVTPSYFSHYAGVLAVPLAIVVGSACHVLADVLGRYARRARLAVGLVSLVTGLAVVGLATPTLMSPVGKVFPWQELAPPVAKLPGCVTADEPDALIQLDVFSRNVARGCPVVVDLGGNSYDLTPGVDIPRPDNPVFQDFAVRYMSSGSASLVVRFRDGTGLSKQTRRLIRSWPHLASADGYQVRRPLLVSAR